MGKYSIGQVVEATVENVLPFGIFARLENGNLAYIRRRELDLDADVNPAQILQMGEKIKAEVIALGDPPRHIELSRRATLGDPWQDFILRYRVGDIVQGKVQSLYPNGVFVRIMAGVNGFIPLELLAPWQVNKPEELLLDGDWVEAEITHIFLDKKKVGLSIRSRVEQRDRAAGIIGYLEGQTIGEANQPTLYLSGEDENETRICPEAIARIGQILVVDDHEEVRIPLADWLIQRGFQVVCAESIFQAIGQVTQKDCRVLLVDLNLLESDGLPLIHYAKQKGGEKYICVMSSPDTLVARAKEIERAEVVQVFAKPLDLEEIERFLVRLSRGESLPTWRAFPSPQINEPNIFYNFGELEGTTASLQQRLQITLGNITERTAAQVGLIFMMDPVSHSISILAKVGNEAINSDAIYGLDDSPVGDVIIEGEPVVENRVNDRAHAKFKKLLDLLPFQSCIGLPVRVQGEFHHAVFLFHQQADAFSTFRQSNAYAGVLLLAAILEEEALNQRIRSLTPLLLSGELAAGFSHEVNNKITGLEIQLRNLLTSRGKLAELKPALNDVLNLAYDLKNTVEIFQHSLNTKEERSTIDVNAIMKRADRLLRPIARKESARTTLKLEPDLPSINGYSIALQQVFLNLMLNAVQQMSFKAESFKWMGQRILEISTSFDDKNNTIKVRFTDTGPGIHWRLWEKIFDLGFSTRGGSGLGLFIARNFIQSFGGTIRVEESFIPLGSTFLVEVPI